MAEQSVQVSWDAVVVLAFAWGDGRASVEEHRAKRVLSMAPFGEVGDIGGGDATLRFGGAVIRRGLSRKTRTRSIGLPVMGKLPRTGYTRGEYIALHCS